MESGTRGAYHFYLSESTLPVTSPLSSESGTCSPPGSHVFSKFCANARGAAWWTQWTLCCSIRLHWTVEGVTSEFKAELHVNLKKQCS